jgi:hypothetical protein
VSVQNPTEYAMLVEVSGAHGGWLPIGTIDRHASTSFGQVYDVGDAWRFRVTSQAHDGGTFRLSRAQLERSGWHVRIPQHIVDALRSDGIQATP